MTREELRVFLDKWYCGCGSPDAASASLLRLLEELDDGLKDGAEGAHKSLPRWIPDRGAMYLLLYHIDHLGLIEHGVGVLASWLTKTGKDVRDALRREKADDFEALHEMHCVHGFDVSGPNTHRCEDA